MPLPTLSISGYKISPVSTRCGRHQERKIGEQVLLPEPTARAQQHLAQPQGAALSASSVERDGTLQLGHGHLS